MNDAVNITNLSVKISEKTIINNINLTIKKGDFIVLLGANGAGKSTLIRSICGLEKFSGEIKVFGKKLKKSEKRKIGYIPQNTSSDINLPISVFEAVSIGRYAKNGIFKKFTDNDKTIVKKAISTVGIKHLRDKSVGELSGGEAQKVSIARVLAQEPEIVLLDEPQLNLDPASRKSFSNLIERLYRKFKFTCLMVTHDIDSIPSSCKTVWMMKDGEIVLEMPNNKNIRNKAKEHKIYA